jgi:hypothetical protein
MAFPSTAFPVNQRLSVAAGQEVRHPSPPDTRDVYPTVAAAKAGIPTATGTGMANVRYPGLTVFIIDEQKEYWFKSGLTDADFVEKNESSSAPCNFDLDDLLQTLTSEGFVE